jgi:hypothetical protein
MSSIITASLKQRRAGLTILALLVAVVSLALPLNSAQAHSTTGIPYHDANLAACLYENGTGTIRSYPPRMVYPWSTRYEEVRWSSDLFKWSGSSWQLVDESKPWLSRVTNYPYGWGSGTWLSVPSQAATWALIYNGLGSGYYAVKEYYKWSNGTVHSQWSGINVSTATNCRI